jgi:carbonic anhydrase
MSSRHAFFSAALAPLMLASCGDSEAPEEAVVEEQQVSEWGYEGAGGPENWGTLNPEFASCEAGTSQSPIDLVGANETELPDPQFNYTSEPQELVNLGHTLQVNYEPGSSMTVGDTRYELAQFHFHTPSEHRLDGAEFPAEVHFVHRGPNDELAVVGVFIEEGDEAAELSNLWSELPQAEGESRELASVQFDEQALLPDDAEHFLYPGSLTTPPCTEGVTWMVLNEPIEMSSEQINSLRSIIGTSNRPVQDLGSRNLRRDI